MSFTPLKNQMKLSEKALMKENFAQFLISIRDPFVEQQKLQVKTKMEELKRTPVATKHTLRSALLDV